MELTTLHVWRNVVNNGYLPLESFLSTQFIADQCLICVDPEFEADMDLAYCISAKLPKVRVVPFAWPKNAPGDGSRIGMASQYALDQVGADVNYVLNVQADEIYPVILANNLRDMWQKYTKSGFECISLKVLNLEHNMQQYQGGDAGSTWEWQCGAGYNSAIKLFKHCPGIRFAHDAWTMEGCATLYHLPLSTIRPVIHAHDNFRDTLISLRRTAAVEIWTDARHKNYEQSADEIEATRDQWWDDPKWTNPVAKFHEMLPDYVKPLVGCTSYHVRPELLEAL